MKTKHSTSYQIIGLLLLHILIVELLFLVYVIYMIYGKVDRILESKSREL